MPGLLNIPESLSIALHICLWIADGDSAFRPSPEIAKELGFSYHHVAKVVQKLVHAGILEAARGPHGGIRLAQDSTTLTLLDIYEAADGDPLLPHRCLLSPAICKGRACGLGLLIEEENARLHKRMKDTTINTLALSLDKSKLEIA